MGKPLPASVQPARRRAASYYLDSWQQARRSRNLL